MTHNNADHRPSVGRKASWIRTAFRRLEPLPAPDKTWTRVAVDADAFYRPAWADGHYDDATAREWGAPDVVGVALSKATLSKALDEGVVLRVGNRWVDDHGKVRVYETHAASYDYVQACLDRARDGDGFLPCGHDAFANPRGLTDDRGRDAVQCKVCDRVHATADVRGGESA